MPLNSIMEALLAIESVAETYPYPSNIMICGVLTALGDVIAQKFSGFYEPWRPVRTLRLGMLGALYIGPITTFWLFQLDVWFGLDFTTGKLLTDQLLMNPLLTFTLIYINTVLSGSLRKSALLEALRATANEMPYIMLRGWPFWIVVQFLNFRFVSVHMRVIVIQAAALIWNTFLAFRADHANREMQALTKLESTSEETISTSEETISDIV